jgi:hypothetical protein
VDIGTLIAKFPLSANSYAAIVSNTKQSEFEIPSCMLHGVTF